MGIFNDLFRDLLNSISDRSRDNGSAKSINYGNQKKDGSHDHRTNRGDDRTPSQKAGDKKRRKD